MSKEIVNKDEKLINEFVEQAIIQGETQLSGDYKTGNKASTKLYRIWKKAKGNEEFSKILVDTLIAHEQVNVKIWICSIALDVRYREADAERILINISQNNDYGILGFNAEMTLKVWKEKGYLLT